MNNNNNDIITQSINNIQEVIGLDQFKLLVNNKDTHVPHIYWGTAH